MTMMMKTIFQNRFFISHAYIICALKDSFPFITYFGLMVLILSKVIMNR